MLLPTAEMLFLGEFECVLKNKIKRKRKFTVVSCYIIDLSLQVVRELLNFS